MKTKPNSASPTPPRSTKEIRSDLQKLQVLYYKKQKVFTDELKAAIAHKQATCPHPEEKIKIRSVDYMEEGRMRSPLEWKEKYCCRCGKVLAQSSDKTRTVWHKVK